ncbi:uncharacterized protein LOC111030186 [Myzus persicae]|uniref:uncharacterized protein LOC111030186 n=1 Tax=Myzus persicae TaxID=13164 RepID=UPI000B936307|nr:uncharacterized protein LOC111030186 [Myzus persicae]
MCNCDFVNSRFSHLFSQVQSSVTVVHSSPTNLVQHSEMLSEAVHNTSTSLLYNPGLMIPELHCVEPHNVKQGTGLEISSIIIPTTKRRGKPKGALQTVIGLKKNRKVLLKKPFKLLHYNERNKLILSWFCTIDVINQSLSSNLKINDTDLNKYNSIPNNIIDELVDLFQVKQFFSPSAWAKVQRIVAQKKSCHSSWLCPLCQKKCSNNTISCDYCLTWYHTKCVNLTIITKKNWYCQYC